MPNMLCLIFIDKCREILQMNTSTRLFACALLSWQHNLYQIEEIYQLLNSPAQHENAGQMFLPKTTSNLLHEHSLGTKHFRDFHCHQDRLTFTEILRSRYRCCCLLYPVSETCLKGQSTHLSINALLMKCCLPTNNQLFPISSSSVTNIVCTYTALERVMQLLLESLCHISVV